MQSLKNMQRLICILEPLDKEQTCLKGETTLIENNQLIDK